MIKNKNLILKINLIFKSFKSNNFFLIYFLKNLINVVSVLYLEKSCSTNNTVVSKPLNLQSFIYGCVLGDAYINKYGAITFNQGFIVPEWYKDINKKSLI